MKIDYQEMLKEVEELTTIEGFVSACYELKENMIFYDRDLVLAAYGSTVEFWLVATLFCAGLESEEVALEVDNKLHQSIKRFFDQLVTQSLPLDIQFLGGHFLKGAGWVIEQRYPVYARMLYQYRTGKYAEVTTIDAVLYKVQQAIGQGDWKSVERLMGQAGSMILRGAHLRPIWFRIGHTRLQMWLSGLQTLVNNFSVAPYFTFPFDDVWAERQKRAKVNGNVVVDLAAFRNFRKDAGGFTDQRILVVPDEYDQELTTLLEGNKVERERAVEVEHRKVLEPLLAMIVGSFGIGKDLSNSYVRNALELLLYWQSPKTASLVMKLLVQLEPWDDMFPFCLDILQNLGSKAVSEIAKYVRKDPLGPMQFLMADVLANMRKSKRVQALLLEIFEQAKWGHGKEIIGGAMLRHGHKDATVIIDDALAKLSPPDREHYIRYLQEMQNT